MRSPEVVTLRAAASVLRLGGTSVPPNLAHAVADWLVSEAVVLGEMEPFAEYINAVVSTVGGPETLIKFGRNEDGSPAMKADTSPAALAVAHLILAAKT